ncbi:MAG: hypothetical protein GEU88_17880 [Solirubrobacterales bacterium]|nr:hypothetical protein [Solirubrobacterales bacterium]
MRHPIGGRRVALAMLAGLATIALGGCSDGGDEDPPSSVPRSFFGVVPQTALAEQDLDRMGQGEVGTMRLVVFWSALDPTPKRGDVNLEGIDGIVLGAARNGIDVLPTVFSTPTWVARDLDRSACDEDCGLLAPRSGAALDAWSDFVGRLADRYGPDGKLWAEHPDVEPRPIRAWQIWNEQNSPTFYQPEPDVGAYERLLAASSDAIHEQDPDATIITGGMLGTPFKGERPAYSAWDFLRRLYEIPGAEDEFDGVGAHPYAAHMKKVRSQVRRIREEIARAGDDATIWVTEVGWASSGPDVPLNRGPEGQAEALTEAFDFLLAKRVDWRIETVTWYSWRDSAEPVCAWCQGSGLFRRRALEPKPSWDAFVAFTGGT